MSKRFLERLASRAGSLFERARERLRVELDAIGANVGGPSDGTFLRIHEQADADARRAKIADRSRQQIDGRVLRPSGLAGDLAGTHRHERALRRPDLLHELEKIGTWITLDVVLDPPLEPANQRRDLANIGGSDMPCFRARVHRDARDAGVDAHLRRLQHRRDGPAAGIANRSSNVRAIR